MGLDYCHRMGVVNRDIKLENTLLDASPKPLVKITDFGYCKASNDSLPKSKVGTPGYTGMSLTTIHCHWCSECQLQMALDLGRESRGPPPCSNLLARRVDTTHGQYTA